jgi:hypothetical protein
MNRFWLRTQIALAIAGCLLLVGCGVKRPVVDYVEFEAFWNRLPYPVSRSGRPQLQAETGFVSGSVRCLLRRLAHTHTLALWVVRGRDQSVLLFYGKVFRVLPVPIPAYYRSLPRSRLLSFVGRCMHGRRIVSPTIQSCILPWTPDVPSNCSSLDIVRTISICARLTFHVFFRLCGNFFLRFPLFGMLFPSSRVRAVEETGAVIMDCALSNALISIPGSLRLLPHLQMVHQLAPKTQGR